MATSCSESGYQSSRAASSHPESGYQSSELSDWNQTRMMDPSGCPGNSGPQEPVSGAQSAEHRRLNGTDWRRHNYQWTTHFRPHDSFPTDITDIMGSLLRTFENLSLMCRLEGAIQNSCTRGPVGNHCPRPPTPPEPIHHRCTVRGPSHCAVCGAGVELRDLVPVQPLALTVERVLPPKPLWAGESEMKWDLWNVVSS